MPRVTVTGAFVPVPSLVEGGTHQTIAHHGETIEVARDVADRWVELGVAEPAGPGVRAGSDEKPEPGSDPVDGMTIAQMRSFAKDNSIKIPAALTSADDIRAHLKSETQA